MKKYLLYFIIQGFACGYGWHFYADKVRMETRAEMILEKPLTELVNYKI